jgi:hypothetical protein
LKYDVEKEQLAARLAYAYVRLLLALEILLFAGSLLAHLSVAIGSNKLYAAYGSILFGGAVIVGIPIVPFVKDSLKWKDQVKSCPEWMWKGALALGVYGIFITCFQAIFPAGDSFADQALTLSGIPLSFDAISLCILYSVLRLGYLDKSEVIVRARNSVIFVSVTALMFWAYRAGYLPHPRSS